MFSTKVNDFVFALSRKIIDGQREQATMDFLQSSSNILHDAEVWPPTLDDLNTELTAAYNFMSVKTGSLLCHYKLVSSKFDAVETEEVISAMLNRVYNCVSDSDTVDIGTGVNINHLVLNLIKVLENPVIHFKALTILGRLLLLLTAVCLYRHLQHRSSQEVVSCLVKFANMAGVPVLKERCHFHHNLILTSPLPKDTQQHELTTVSVQDVVCLFLTTFQQPVGHLAMENDGWRWLMAAMDYRNLIQEKSYSMALQKLSSVLHHCMNPQHKGRLLSLFAECYFYMNCPQISIQTYRDVLQTDGTLFTSLYGLSLVYQHLDMRELELESLNLLVMALADRERRQKERVPVMCMDEMVWSIAPPTPEVSYIKAKVTFARRCLQLKRYPEAAEQYASLIRMLQQEDSFFQFEKHEMNQELNIAQILVESAEVLLITKQYQDCIKLCDQTQPVLSADDTMVTRSQSFNIDDNHIPLENSQDDILNLLMDDSSQSFDSCGPSSAPSKHSLLTGKNGNDSLTNLCMSFEKSRKRMRSGEPMNIKGVQDLGDGHNAESRNGDDDIMLPRLLLCKSDALVLSEGFTDNAVSCLQEFMDILLHHPFTLTTPTTNPPPHPGGDTPLSATPHPPLSKRQRINSDGKAAACSGGSSNSKDDGQSGSTSPGRPDDEWSTLLVKTALRMAVASWNRKRFPSVINSCRVVDQLDTGNTDAAYLKTMVMSASGGLQRELIASWLNHRGVTYLLDRKQLQEVIRKLQQQQTSDHPNENEMTEPTWWKWKETHFVELDVKCLQTLLEMH